MTERERLSRKLTLSMTAFAAGLLLMLAGVAVFNSRWLVGVALVLLMSIGAFAYHWFRCPHCGNSILQYTLREMRAWLQGGPTRCPFCATDLEPREERATPVTTS